MTTNADYSLGNSDAEHEGLMLKARVLRQWTDRFLQAGGLVIFYEPDLTPPASAFTRFELPVGQRSALDDVSARVPSA